MVHQKIHGFQKEFPIYINGCHFRVPGLKNLGRVCGGLITDRNYESLIGMPVNPQKYYDMLLSFVSSESTWLVFQQIFDVLKLSMSREDQTIHAKVKHVCVICLH